MKYSICERVVFYTSDGRQVGTIFRIVDHKNKIYETRVDECFFTVHEKQIRKLKPKKKARTCEKCINYEESKKR